MNCPECGEVCNCQPERVPKSSDHSTGPAADVRETPILEPNALLGPETGALETKGLGSDADGESASGADARPASDTNSVDQENSAWRDELSARLNRYRSRRRMPPPRYPSLRLRFDRFDKLDISLPGESPRDDPRPAFEPVSAQALALDRTIPDVPIQSARAPSAPPVAASSPNANSRPTGAKIIEFPKYFQEPLSYEPPAPSPDQLAEPVMDRPRILEVPEFAPPPPALGGITIEPAMRQELEKRPGIDIPLQSASLTRRMIASLLDGLIIGAASALFALIFWKVAAVHPPRLEMLALTLGISLFFWAAYQYLLLVYSGKTPGLQVAGLELARFDGSRTSRSLRRWRVLASYLSAASLGMGYAWVFLDEDVLCWHDRATRTYLAPRKRAPAESKPQ